MRWSLLRAATLGALAACTFMVGCASARTVEDPYEITSTNRPPRIKLVVRNLNFMDARLYAHRNSGRRMIGQVGGKQEAEFDLEWPMSEPLSIEIDMVAGPRCVTEQMQVDRGDILELVIDPVFSSTQGCR